MNTKEVTDCILGGINDHLSYQGLGNVKIDRKMASFSHSMKTEIDYAPGSMWMAQDVLKQLKANLTDKKMINITCDVNTTPYNNESINEINVRLTNCA